MKKNRSLLLAMLAIVATAVIFASCKKDGDYDAHNCRSAGRVVSDPSTTAHYIGFRVVFPIP